MRLRHLAVAVPLVALTLTGCVPADDGLPLPGTVVAKWRDQDRLTGLKYYMRTKTGQGTSEGSVAPISYSRCDVGDPYPQCAKER